MIWLYNFINVVSVWGRKLPSQNNSKCKRENIQQAAYISSSSITPPSGKFRFPGVPPHTGQMNVHPGFSVPA